MRTHPVPDDDTNTQCRATRGWSKGWKRVEKEGGARLNVPAHARQPREFRWTSLAFNCDNRSFLSGSSYFPLCLSFSFFLFFSVPLFRRFPFVFCCYYRYQRWSNEYGLGLRRERDFFCYFWIHLYEHFYTQMEDLIIKRERVSGWEVV